MKLTLFFLFGKLLDPEQTTSTDIASRASSSDNVTLLVLLDWAKLWRISRGTKTRLQLGTGKRWWDHESIANRFSDMTFASWASPPMARQFILIAPATSALCDKFNRGLTSTDANGLLEMRFHSRRKKSICTRSSRVTRSMWNNNWNCIKWHWYSAEQIRGNSMTKCIQFWKMSSS